MGKTRHVSGNGTLGGPAAFASGAGKLAPGTLVRMSARAREALRSNGSRKYVTEFGGRAGVVVGLTDYGNGQVGPELDVRWIPGYLRYAHAPEDLVVSRKKVRGRRKKAELARRIAALGA